MSVRPAAGPFLASLILSYCGVIYEVCLAQTMSILFGQSFLQYGVTFGLFMASMGAGSYSSERSEANGKALYGIQLRLIVIAPLIMGAMMALSLFASDTLAYVTGLVGIAFIGYLTGQELPLLIRMAGSRAASAVLAFDYFGMLLACGLFPMLLLPKIGLIGSFTLNIVFNSLVALVYRPLAVRTPKAILAAWALLALILTFNSDRVAAWLSRQYL